MAEKKKNEKSEIFKAPYSEFKKLKVHFNCVWKDGNDKNAKK